MNKLIKIGFLQETDIIYRYNNIAIYIHTGGDIFSIGGIRRYDGTFYNYKSVDDIINMILPELRSIKLKKLLNE